MKKLHRTTFAVSLMWILMLAAPARAATPSWCIDTCVVSNIQACANLKALDQNQVWQVLCSAPVGLDGAYLLTDGDGTMKADLLAHPDGTLGVFISGGSDLGFSPYRRVIQTAEIESGPDQIHVSQDTTALAAAADPVVQKFFSALNASLGKEIAQAGTGFAKIDETTLGKVTRIRADFVSIASAPASVDKDLIQKYLKTNLQDLEAFEKTGVLRRSASSATSANWMVDLMSEGAREDYLAKFFEAFPDGSFRPGEVHALIDYLKPFAEKTANRKLVDRVSNMHLEFEMSLKAAVAGGKPFTFEVFQSLNPGLADFFTATLHEVLKNTLKGEWLLKTANWWSLFYKYRCARGNRYYCDLRHVLDEQGRFITHLNGLMSEGSITGSVYPMLNTLAQGEESSGTDFQALFDAWFTREQPRLTGLGALVGRWVAALNQGDRQVISDMLRAAFPAGSGTSELKDLLPPVMEILRKFQFVFNDQELKKVEKFLVSGADGGFLGRFNTYSGLRKEEPEFTRFIDQLRYQLTVQSEDLVLMKLQMVWWRLRLDIDCAEGKENACVLRPDFDGLEAHYNKLGDRAVYSGLNSAVDGDPDSPPDYQAIFDSLYGLSPKGQDVWLDLMLGDQALEELAGANPELEALYQKALRSATAAFLNRDGLKDQRELVRGYIENYSKFIQDGQAAAAEASMIDVKANCAGTLVSTWNDQWDESIKNVTAEALCSEGVDCSYNGLLDYVQTRGGQPPVPDLTLIGTEEAKALLGE